jgi:hypothetical protein
LHSAFACHFKPATPAPFITPILATKTSDIAHPTSFAVKPSVPKYTYIVQRNDIGLYVEDLGDVTMNLNDSNQLTPELGQAAKVLPLKWARMLAKGVSRYVDRGGCWSFIGGSRRGGGEGGLG